MTVQKGNTARSKRYRKQHRRIDYAPSPDVLAVIEKHLAAGLDNCLAGTIDRLILAGDGVTAPGSHAIHAVAKPPFCLASLLENLPAKPA